MPTPIKYFYQIAEKWGNVDPNDHQAIEKWFIHDFPKLSKKEINAILDELIDNNNEESIEPEKIIYPSEIPLPMFKDVIPVQGISWTNSYLAIVNYLRSLTKSKRKSKQ